MKVIWTDFASGNELEIYQYYKEKAGFAVANTI